MTAPRQPVPAGGYPRRRPLISHADLITAVAELAPDDPQRARDIAVLLGLRSAPAQAARPPEPVVPPPEPAGNTTAARYPADYAAAGYRAAADVVPSQLIPLAEGGQAAEGERWLLEVEALGAPPPGEAPGALAVAPLFQPRWMVGIIFAALATDVPGRPDLARAVAVIARGRSLGAMPLLPRPSLRRGAQVLVDLGAGMEPFRDDQESFVAELRRALGAGRVEVLHFADCPSRDVVAPGAAEWTAYRAPLGGVPVVLLTDLGLGSATGEARPVEWRAFLDGIRAEGSPCIAFVPYPPERVPRLLHTATLVVRWDDETVIYEAHVRGLTLRHPGVPADLRGTYAGLAHPAVIEHLTRLGVTAVKLLPVHQLVPERELADRSLTNYWGYNTIAFLAPHNGYASTRVPGGQVGEFKAMVKALHQAGIEVILDVVYNHTAEGDHRGATLLFRGIDNAAYYRLSDTDKRRYFDYSACGNWPDMASPRVLQLIMESLRYWVTEMHVDGFRFDLAAALTREQHDVDMRSAFLDLVQQDPVVSGVKLIAEPWDVGQMDSYQLGNFPPSWSEWNGKYRDTMRDFWRGRAIIGEFATRLVGSIDLYGTRRPAASINYVTCHDGFTLTDLVPYDHKHNEANGESNRDGSDDNRSWNCGVEGPIDDPVIVELRERQKRNFLATLLLSRGIPMLLAGDEMGRTQGGNNNAYCQDNEISWLDWSGFTPGGLDEFIARLTRIRREYPVFRRRSPRLHGALSDENDAVLAVPRRKAPGRHGLEYGHHGDQCLLSRRAGRNPGRARATASPPGQRRGGKGDLQPARPRVRWRVESPDRYRIRPGSDRAGPASVSADHHRIAIARVHGGGTGHVHGAGSTRGRGARIRPVWGAGIRPGPN